MILQARIPEWVAMPSSRGSSQPTIEPGSPVLQVDSLPSEPPGKPKNTGVGSLPLLKGIFLSTPLSHTIIHSLNDPERASQVVAVVKNLLANARNMGSIPGPGRSHRSRSQLSLWSTTTEPML